MRLFVRHNRACVHRASTPLIRLKEKHESTAITRFLFNGVDSIIFADTRKFFGSLSSPNHPPNDANDRNPGDVNPSTPFLFCSNRLLNFVVKKIPTIKNRKKYSWARNGRQLTLRWEFSQNRVFFSRSWLYNLQFHFTDLCFDIVGTKKKTFSNSAEN